MNIKIVILEHHSTQNAKYNLYAIIHHRGYMGGGHYVA
jgi:ubiquitin C-terminal hydrolase